MTIMVKNRTERNDLVNDVELEFDNLGLPAITCVSCESQFVLLGLGSKRAFRIGINIHLLHCPFCGKPLSAKLLKEKKMQKYEYLYLDIGGREAEQRTELLNEYAAKGWELLNVGDQVWWAYLRRGVEMENKKVQYILSLGVLSRDGEIISPNAFHLSAFPTGIRDENGVMVGEITDVAIDGNKLIFTIEHCDEFVEKLKKRGTWTITSAVKSSRG